MKNVIIFSSAILFGLGLEISQMTDPNKVIGFLDIFGKWDPSLSMVMAGAIFVNSIFYYLIKRKKTPLATGTKFDVPIGQVIDQKLIIGSGLFGVGWGVAGFCPGPLMANLFNFQIEIIVAIFFMFFGFFIHHQLFKPKL